MNVTVEEIKEKIRSTLNELMEEDVSKITDDQLFVEELGVNSIVIVQVFLTCQETYGVDLTEEMKLAEPMSIQMLAEKIHNKVISQ
ncbi:MAG: acyl carrier protein [Ruminococcus sp.]|jgi:acyl carrier protein|nr:acyl carrier protein [Ruminococcus sp.]